MQHPSAYCDVTGCEKYKYAIAFCRDHFGMWRRRESSPEAVEAFTREWAVFDRMSEKRRAASLKKLDDNLARREKLDHRTVVYFIQNSQNDLIKIGYSTDVRDRMYDLQSASSTKLVLLATMPGDRDLESEIHKQFAAARVRGEWFEPIGDLLEYIDEFADPVETDD